MQTGFPPPGGSILLVECPLLRHCAGSTRHPLEVPLPPYHYLSLHVDLLPPVRGDVHLKRRQVHLAYPGEGLTGAQVALLSRREPLLIVLCQNKGDGLVHSVAIPLFEALKPQPAQRYVFNKQPVHPWSRDIAQLALHPFIVRPEDGLHSGVFRRAGHHAVRRILRRAFVTHGRFLKITIGHLDVVPRGYGNRVADPLASRGDGVFSG